MTFVPTARSTGTTSFDVVLADGTHEVVAGADAYQQESSMTTFFRNETGRQAVDCWSIRVASFRTEQILAIRRLEADLAEVRHLHPA
jgi:hypothetical protein